MACAERSQAAQSHPPFLPAQLQGRQALRAGAGARREDHRRGGALRDARSRRGPIIEQDIARVDHSNDPQELTAIGRDVESAVLARAVTWHAQRRVLVNGNKTVVFR